MLVHVMKIGLISDTHDNIRNIQKVIISFNDIQVRVVIHAGDIVSPGTVEAFDGMRLIGVLGNNDLQIHELTDAFDRIGGQLNGEFCEIEQDNLIFAVYHGTNSRRKESLIHVANMTWLFVVIHTEFKIKNLEKLCFLILELQMVGFLDMV